MLVLDDRQIIAGGNHAAIQDDEVAVVWRKDDRLLRATTEGDAGEEDGGVIKQSTEEAKIHWEAECGLYWSYSFYKADALPCEALFFTPARKLHTERLTPISPKPY